MRIKKYKYWAWWPWIRWFVPLPILLWFSRRNFHSLVWYDDTEVRLELTRKSPMTEWEKENMRRGGYEV